MGHKRLFDEVMREFAAEHADELDHLTPEQIAERTGYSLSTVRDYLQHQQTARLQEEQRKETERIRALEAGAVTYVTSSGSARVVYFPLLGEVNISSTYPKNWGFQNWGRGYSQREEGRSLFLSSQDTFEIGIYLMGLQPHIRDVLVRIAKDSLCQAFWGAIWSKRKNQKKREMEKCLQFGMSQCTTPLMTVKPLRFP